MSVLLSVCAEWTTSFADLGEACGQRSLGLWAPHSEPRYSLQTFSEPSFSFVLCLSKTRAPQALLVASLYFRCASSHGMSVLLSAPGELLELNPTVARPAIYPGPLGAGSFANGSLHCLQPSKRARRRLWQAPCLSVCMDACLCVAI